MRASYNTVHLSTFLRYSVFGRIQEAANRAHSRRSSSEGTRITDYISLGVIAKDVPSNGHPRGFDEDGKWPAFVSGILPAHVVVYYVIALALYMQSSYREVLRCLLEGIQWLRDPSVKDQGGGQIGNLAGPRTAELGATATIA